MVQFIVSTDPRNAPAGLRFPVEAGLRHAGWYRRHKGLLTANMAKGYARQKSTVVGLPQTFDTHARFVGGISYVQTSVVEAAAMSGYVVARLVGGGLSGSTKGQLMATSPGVSALDAGRISNGAYIRQDSPTTLLAGCAQWDGSVASMRLRNVPYVPGKWALFTFRFDETRHRAYNRTQGGGGSEPTPYTAQRDPTINAIRIGSSGLASAYAGEVDIAFSYFAIGFHEDAQEAALVADIKAKFAVEMAI